MDSRINCFIREERYIFFRSNADFASLESYLWLFDQHAVFRSANLYLSSFFMLFNVDIYRM